MPAAEAAVLVDGANPLAHGLALNFVLLIFFAFGFNDEDFVVGQLSQEVRAVLMFAAVEDVTDFKPEVVVLHSASDARASVEVEGRRAFPAAITDAKVDV